MLKLGCKIDEVRIDGQLELLRRDLDHFSSLDIPAVEIPVHGLDAIFHGRLNGPRVSAIKPILAFYGFTYSIHAPNPLNLMDRDHGQLHEQVFRASLEFASKIGSTVVVYHAGRFVPEEKFGIPGFASPSEGERSFLLDREAYVLGALADEFPGVCICVENARPYLCQPFYCYGEHPWELLRQVRRIGRPNVRINLDVGHLYLAAKYYGFDPVEAVREIREAIGHVHVHDNFGLSIHYGEKQQTHLVPFGRGDAHMPVGWGGIPFAAILETFIDSYRGLMITELRSRYFEQAGESMGNLKILLRSLGRRFPEYFKLKEVSS